MRHPLLRIDAPWQARICFILAGAIFMLAQFIAAGPPSGRLNVTATAYEVPVVAETESDTTLD